MGTYGQSFSPQCVNFVISSFREYPLSLSVRTPLISAGNYSRTVIHLDLQIQC